MPLSVTKRDIVTFHPCDCDSIKRIDELFGTREILTAADALILDIPEDHRLWLLLRPQLIEPSKLQEIDVAFLSMIEHTCIYFEQASLSHLYGRIPYVLRANRHKQSDQETYYQLLEIVKRSIGDS